jgi:hypothetical protein
MRKLALFAAIGLMAWTSSAQTQISRSRVRGTNISINSQGDGDSCADLKVSSSGELAQAVEKFTLSRAEAPTLELNAGDRGVVSVRGWKQSGYSVEACKMAAAEDRGTAESTLRSMSVTHSAGKFGYTGPANDSATWQVYFIIHTPDNAALDVEVKNAPVSINGVNGNIKVRAAGGPLAIRASSGTIDAQTTNGPISFDGDGGEVHLIAHNGPISVKVQKDIWQGSTLEARTVNGPMSVSLPAAFQSSMRVETSGHAPMSCQHEVCAHAYSNLTGEQRVLQMNGSSETVRIHTENGPLSISGPKPKKLL